MLADSDRLYIYYMLPCSNSILYIYIRCDFVFNVGTVIVLVFIFNAVELNFIFRAFKIMFGMLVDSLISGKFGYVLH